MMRATRYTIGRERAGEALHMFDASDPIVSMCIEVCSSSIQRIGDIAFVQGAAVAFGLMGMAEAIRERTWNCIMCEGDTDGDTCEWCQAPRGLRCPACEVGPCEDHVRSAGDRSKADG